MAEDRHDEKKSGKIGFLRLAASLLALIVLTALAVTLLRNGGKLSIDGVRRAFSGIRGANYAPELYFDYDKGGAFGDLDGALLCAGTLGVQLLAEDGTELFRETLQMKSPAVYTAGQWAVAYDLGGTELRVMDKSGLQSKITAEGPIVSATVSPEGYLAVCLHGDGGKRRVSVYSDKGTELFQWFSGEAYPLTAAVAGDKKSLAVLSYGASGSAVNFFSLDSDVQTGEYITAEEVLLDILWLDSGRLLTIGEASAFQLSGDGSRAVICEYGDRSFSGFAYSGDGLLALYLRDYQVGSNGAVETYDLNGKPLGSLPVEQAVGGISAAGGHVAVLYTDEAAVYNRNMELQWAVSELTGASSVMMRGDGSALVTLLQSARLLPETA